jgi:hypothetical protein
VFWYGLVPVAGAFVNRRNWRLFRRRFDDLCLKPFLDYAACGRDDGGIYRFIGGFESITGGHTIWIRNEELTIPVSLDDAYIYVLSMPQKDEPSWGFTPGNETPVRIKWDHITALTEEAKIFVGGALMLKDNRMTFCSEQGNPLLVIFYEGPDRSLAGRIIRAGRDSNEYWNFLTPYALTLGSLSQLTIAMNFVNRPAYMLTAITAFLAVFIPLFPMAPPGFALTILYKRLWWYARIFRVYRDLTRLPLKYLPSGGLPGPEGRKLLDEQNQGRLPDGERYECVYFQSLPGEAKDAMENMRLKLLVPEKKVDRRGGWYIFGAPPENGCAGALPGEPRDVFAPYAAVPGNPDDLSRGFTYKAYILEMSAWIALLAGICLNIAAAGIVIVVLN